MMCFRAAPRPAARASRPARSHAAALRRSQLEEDRERRPHGLAARRHDVGLAHRRVGDLRRGVERFVRAVCLAPPVVDRQLVRDAKEPWAQRWQLAPLRQLMAGAGERLLDDVLAIGDRTVMRAA
jgi:hypothetical protein